MPLHFPYVQKWMQWRKWQKWRKIASLWQFELDAKSGPLETGDFGEIGDFGENRRRAGDNSEKRPGPSESADFGEVFVIFKHVNGWPIWFRVLTNSNFHCERKQPVRHFLI